MAKSEALFLLVKSLNQAEKRYIKLFSNKNGNENSKKYIHLFNVLAKNAHREIYDETLIETELKGIIHPDHLSYEKNYLYQFILKCLRNFNSQDTPRIQLQELIIDINLLYERGLLKETIKLIKKGKKIAEKYNYDLQYLELTFIERRIIRQFKKKASKLSLATIQEESEKKLSQISQLIKTLKGGIGIF